MTHIFSGMCFIVFDDAAPSEHRITIVSSPSGMSNLLVATNSSGHLFIWDVKTKELVFR